MISCQFRGTIALSRADVVLSSVSRCDSFASALDKWTIPKGFQRLIFIMLVKKSFKTELDLTKEQVELCRKHIGARRFVYNWMLAQCILARENGQKRPSGYALLKKFRAEVKPNLEWYSEISSRCEEGAADGIDKAFEYFFRRIKRGKRGKDIGFPKFKRKHDGVGTFQTYGLIRVSKDSVKIQKIGMLKTKEHDYIPTNTHVIHAVISTRGGRWFISCLCDIDVNPEGKSDGVIGVDLGIKHAITMSDGTIVDSPKPLVKYTRKLRKLNKSLARKKNGSNHQRDAIDRLSKVHYRISCIRSDFTNKITTSLVKTKRTIVIENLNVSGMMANRHLAKAISDVGFREIRRQLEYKCRWYGNELVIADRWYPSSKICSSCGEKNDNLTLADRDWVCPKCGTHLDRDINAAMNLAALAVNHTESLNGRGDGSSVTISNDTTQPVYEASIYIE